MKEVDEYLNSQSGNQIRNAIRELPQDPPSMGWEASLNSRLQAEYAARNRRHRWLMSFKLSAGGLAVAGAAMAVWFIVVFSFDTPSVEPIANIESQILDAHVNAQTADQLSGAAAYEFRDSPASSRAVQ